MMSSFLTWLIWASWLCKLGKLTLDTHHHFFHPFQLLNSVKTTNTLVLINFILRKLGFSEMLTHTTTLEVLLNILIHVLGISMLVRLCQLGHWELAESAVSPLQSIMSASAVHVVH